MLPRNSSRSSSSTSSAAGLTGAEAGFAWPRALPAAPRTPRQRPQSERCDHEHDPSQPLTPSLRPAQQPIRGRRRRLLRSDPAHRCPPAARDLQRSLPGVRHDGRQRRVAACESTVRRQPVVRRRRLRRASATRVARTSGACRASTSSAACRAWFRRERTRPSTRDTLSSSTARVRFSNSLGALRRRS